MRYILFSLMIVLPQFVLATEIATDSKRWAKFYPYVPEKNEYRAEIGGMWENANLYWMGFTYGRHLRRCYFTQSEKCQQYLDFTGGLGSESALTQGLFLIGPRWQYVNFPNPYSPSISLFTGIMNIRDEGRDKSVGLAGVGVGFTATLHPKLDIRWENRFAYADVFWTQSVFSVSLKLDNWVDYFGGQMKKLGLGAVETTGTVLKTTIEAPKTFFEWFQRKKSGTASENAAPEKNE